MITRRVMIAAPKSGSGKTSVTIAFLENLKKRGIKVCSFKCGPDYIDPLFHKSVLGIPSYNLDTFFTDEKTTDDIFKMHSKDFEFAVMEGVMGLFDGLSGVREEGSSYHLAKVTDTPIILTVDTKGACRSIIPLIAGFKAYDTEGLIKGVILNRTSEAVFNLLAPMIEKETGIKVVGFIPDKKELTVQSRHLGLFTPDAQKNIEEIIEKLSEEFENNVDLDEILNISKQSEPDEESDFSDTAQKEICTIAVSKDEAFCFIYEDNIRLLKEMGAKIVYFSPINDERIPEDANGVLLVGGYPEEYLDKLSSNKSMLSSVKEAHEGGMPIVAECGGFMYLHKSIEDREKKEYKTAGIIDAKCTFTGRSVRFGYIEIKEKTPSFLGEGGSIKGHEFHYYDSEKNGDSCIIGKPYKDRTYEGIIENKNVFLGFPHLYYPSNPEFAKNFVEKCVDYKNSKKV